MLLKFSFKLTELKLSKICMKDFFTQFETIFEFETNDICIKRAGFIIFSFLFKDGAVEKEQKSHWQFEYFRGRGVWLPFFLVCLKSQRKKSQRQKHFLNKSMKKSVEFNKIKVKVYFSISGWCVKQLIRPKQWKKRVI